MPSTTSGTTNFTLDVDDIIEQALDPLGGEHSSGIEVSKARRVLNLILIQMQNKNIPLNKLDFVSQALTINDPDFVMSGDIVDILEASLKDTVDNNEIPMARKGLREYQQIPNKAMSNRPNLFTTERLNSGVTVTVWPVPNKSTYTMTMLVAKRVEDITASYQKIDIPYRYYPLLVKWLSYELSMSRVGIPEEIKNRLKNEYLEAMPDTFDEDRERTDTYIRPGGISGR
jgi:hypothetical protein